MEALKRDVEQYPDVYREKNGQRFVADWLMRNPSALTKTNENIVLGYTKARFSILRIEKNLSHGAIHVGLLTPKPRNFRNSIKQFLVIFLLGILF